MPSVAHILGVRELPDAQGSTVALDAGQGHSLIAFWTLATGKEVQGLLGVADLPYDARIAR
ncbi:MAG TPA: hypothetical protein VKV95_02445 [Terriglobia bacterium]|nr:hypothetical protein [Terriglobia bacterium]